MGNIVAFGRRCRSCGERETEIAADCSVCGNRAFLLVGVNTDEEFKIRGFRCTECNEFYPADNDR